MTSDMGASGQDNKQRNLIIAVVVVVVLLCCCCISAAVGYYLWENGDQLMEGLNSSLPALHALV